MGSAMYFFIWKLILNNTDENNYNGVCEYVRELLGELYRGKEK